MSCLNSFGSTKNLKFWRIRKHQDKGAVTYYVTAERGEVVSKMLMHDYGGREGGWPNYDISKQVFLQSKMVLKQKATNNYLPYIFALPS